MAQLKVTFVGLNRITGSLGLALKRYERQGGKHQFTITGHDYDNAHEKEAQKMGATDTSDHDLGRAVSTADIVVLAVSYEDVEETLKLIAGFLRDGAVVLDISPLKQPSLRYAEKHLSEEQHLVGITPILNPKHLFDNDNSLQNATEDLFDNSAILLSPAANCIKAAVDLAFNFASIVGSKPRFLDPLEHDAVLGMTESLPRLVGVVLFQTLMEHPNWQDMGWFTNPGFAALTRPLFDIHPDALRDELLNNSEAMTRGLDQLIQALQAYRSLLGEQDRDSIEAALIAASDHYEKWVNARHKANWDENAKMPEVDRSQSILNTLFGSMIGNRLGSKKDET
ncbi:MAG: prephenate dehydrogenase [Anaerolineae bacterium]|nr:prephenate dehydrogenase [Anaerolineae bacterium]MCA9889280.1 prephenate dehydrogenase [Anaerolineae bacterium]MCA9891463.1 prephenate dehydrogenase [Anaerolineae bacterium]MCB9461699.1 prephenate dehydrogenase [Anaerolineaceae bacterium]